MTTFLELVANEIGAPYVYGGDSPAGGFDCSGLVQWAAGQLGVSVPRGATDQLHALPATTQPVAGDLVFFNTGDGWEAGHVGICADTGCATMIDAPHTGAQVRRESVQGFGTIVGYRRLTGAASPGGGVTLAGIGPGGIIPDPSGLLDPFGILGGGGGLDSIPGLSELFDAISSLPGEVLKVMLGGHTPGELALRAVEITGGALIFAAGAVVLLMVVAEGGNSGRAVKGGRRAARQLDEPRRRAVSAYRRSEPQRAPRSATRAGVARLNALQRAEAAAGDVTL